jgi:hypothetical protein
LFSPAIWVSLCFKLQSASNSLILTPGIVQPASESLILTPQNN